MKLLCVVLWMVTFFHGTVAGIPIHRVVVDLTCQDLHVTVRLAKKGGESFESMCTRLRPLAAISGDFFDPATMHPVGDIVLNGRLVHDGFVGPALIVLAKDNSTHIVSQADYNKIPKNALRLGMQTGPFLVQDSRIDVDLTGFPHISRSQSACRTAIGLTTDGKLVMIAIPVPITLYKLAQIMQKASCTTAAALDGGSSTGIYYDNRVKVKPAKLMVSLLVVLLPKNQ